jgi:UDP-galactopyranose mutase
MFAHDGSGLCGAVFTPHLAGYEWVNVIDRTAHIGQGATGPAAEPGGISSAKYG